MKLLLKNAKAVAAVVSVGFAEWLLPILNLRAGASLETVIEAMFIAGLVWLVPNR